MGVVRQKKDYTYYSVQCTIFVVDDNEYVSDF